MIPCKLCSAKSSNFPLKYHKPTKIRIILNLEFLLKEANRMNKRWNQSNVFAWYLVEIEKFMISSSAPEVRSKLQISEHCTRKGKLSLIARKCFTFDFSSNSNYICLTSGHSSALNCFCSNMQSAGVISAICFHFTTMLGFSNLLIPAGSIDLIRVSRTETFPFGQIVK